MTFGFLMELVSGVVGLIVQALYLRFRIVYTIRSIMIVTVLAIPAVVLSLESMNSFLTCDESYIVYEPVDIINNSLPMWNMGSFRTTDVLVGIPLAIVKSFTGATMDVLAICAKSLHWLLSFLLILIIGDFLRKLSQRVNATPSMYLLTLYSILLFPVVLLAQKIINYDALSMLCGVVSILLLAAEWNGKRNYRMFLSAVFAAFAAQEKLIASPLVLILMMLIPLHSALGDREFTMVQALRKTVFSTVFTVCAVLSVFFGSFLLVSLVNCNGAPGYNAINVVLPLLNAVWPFLHFFGVEVSTLLSHPLSGKLYMVPLEYIAIMAMMICVNILLTVGGVTIRRMKVLGTIKAWNISVAGYVLFVGIYIFGIVGTYVIKAYLAPYYPFSTGAFEGFGILFNRSFVFFGAQSIYGHFVGSIGWAYVTLTNALPIIFFCMAVANMAGVVIRRRAAGLIMDVVFIGAMIVPLVYGVLQVAVANRYLNLFLLLIGCKIVVDFMMIYGQRNHSNTLIVFLVILLLAEILPFRPLYGAFRPWWSNYSSRYNSTPSRGVINPWWMGWGEETALAGRQIQKRLEKENPTLSGVTIFTNFLGEWLHKQNDSKIMSMDTLAMIGYSTNDFFVLNRLGITQSDITFPAHVEPFATIRFRGFVQGWVFRGNDLAAAGFRFEKTKRAMISEER